jgi:hypothetical protein
MVIACWTGDGDKDGVRAEDLMRMEYCVAEKIEVERTKLWHTNNLCMEVERKIEDMPGNSINFAVFDVKHPYAIAYSPA